MTTTHNPTIIDAATRHLWRYSVPYARRDGTTRTYRRTVTAHDPDDARQMVAILDPAYSHTVPPGPRRGGEVLAEARAELTRGVAHFNAPLTAREEREEMLADHELMADEFHGRSW